MIVVIVHLHVAETHLRDFLALAEAHALATQRESGCLEFTILPAPCGRHFCLFERFRDAQALADHRTTQHYATWKAEIEPMLAEPRHHYESPLPT